jgi:Glucose / Sorbosone dehydrogenase
LSQRRRLLLSAVLIAALCGAVVLAVLALSDGSDGNDAAGIGEGDPGPAQLRVTLLARGIDMPWGLTFLPDGSALVGGRQSALIHRIPASGGRPRLVGRVPGVERSSEGGLLGLAASPDFAADRIVYAYVSASPTNRIVALRIGRGARSLRQQRVVLDGIVTADRHHGGWLRFGPDGNLWITTGDAFDAPEIAADRESLNGKVLRVRPDGSVPADNPFGTPVFVRTPQRPGSRLRSRRHGLCLRARPQRLGRAECAAPGSGLRLARGRRHQRLRLRPADLPVPARAGLPVRHRLRGRRDLDGEPARTAAVAATRPPRPARGAAPRLPGRTVWAPANCRTGTRWRLVGDNIKHRPIDTRRNEPPTRRRPHPPHRPSQERKVSSSHSVVPSARLDDVVVRALSPLNPLSDGLRR